MEEQKRNRSRGDDAVRKNHRKRSKKKSPMQQKLVLAAACIGTVLIAFIGAFMIYYKTAVKPPEQSTQIGHLIADDDSDDTQGTIGTREERVYTFLVVGMDDGNGNTDTMMVGKFDTATGSLNVVSIPRDTLVNVPWSTKKVNSLYANGGISKLKSGLAEIMGFEVDFYVMVDLEAFSTLVDAIDGVWYDVPQNMELNGVSVSKGYQRLNGQQAIVVMRTRNVYPQADIGRIDTQQHFLMAVAEQVMENKDSLSISDLANLFLNYVDTDLTYGNIIWFAQEFFRIGLSDINFSTLPANYWATINGLSYVCIYPDEWIEMINEKINPFEEDIELSDLNILTMDSSGRVYSTSGIYADSPNWGNTSSSSGSNNNNSNTSSAEESSENTDTPSDTNTSSNSGTSSDTGTSGGTNTPSDTGTSESTDTSSDTGTSESTDTSSDTGTSESTDTSSDTGTSENTGTPGDTGTSESTDTPSDTGTSENSTEPTGTESSES